MHLFFTENNASRIVCNADYCVQMQTKMCCQIIYNCYLIKGLTRETRQSKNVRQVFARTTLKVQCVSIFGITLWNSLDRNIQRAKTVFIFQKMYKSKTCVHKAECV